MSDTASWGAYRELNRQPRQPDTNIDNNDINLITLELTNLELKSLALAAHRNNQTLSQFIINAATNVTHEMGNHRQFLAE